MAAKKTDKQLQKEAEMKKAQNIMIKWMELKRMVYYYLVTWKSKAECKRQLNKFKTYIDNHKLAKKNTEDVWTFEQAYNFLKEQIECIK